MRFWLGGYTADMGGDATGIGVLVAGAADDVLAGGPLGVAGDAVRTAGSPSWLTAHPRLDVVYAALEGAGTVQAFRRTGEASLAPLGAPVDAGDAVCHVAVAPDGASLLASCWGDGRVVRMRLDADGRPSAPSIAPAAIDPHARAGDSGSTPAGVPDAGAVDLAAAARALREAAGPEYAHLVPDHDLTAPDGGAAASAPHLFGGAGFGCAGFGGGGPDGAGPGGAGSDPAAEPVAERVSRAHQALFLPGGLVATTDMGLDLVRLWRAGEAGLRLAQQIALPFGSGPRHMVWHPSGHLFVVTELSCEVFALVPDASGTWRLVGGSPLSPATTPGLDHAAEIALSRDGEFLYAGVRGSNTLAALRVRAGGSGFAPIALVESGVDWPRHHIVARDTVVVAGQWSGEVVSLTIDGRTGVPGRVRHRTAAGSPTCLLPVR